MGTAARKIESINHGEDNGAIHTWRSPTVVQAAQRKRMGDIILDKSFTTSKYSGFPLMKQFDEAKTIKGSILFIK